jgi:hypothetical protein
MCIASRLVPQCHALPARVWYRTRAFGPSFASVATAASTSLAVALIVGTVLNLINQGDALLADRHVNLAKIVLTFVLLYSVATYGAVSYRLSATRQPGNPLWRVPSQAASLPPAYFLRRPSARSVSN